MGYTSIVSEQRNLVAQEADLGDFDRRDSAGVGAEEEVE